MPHLVILYSGNLDARTDMAALCRGLAGTMLAQRDEADKPVFPPGGTRVFAYPAPHFAVSDGGTAVARPARAWVTRFRNGWNWPGWPTTWPTPPVSGW